LDKALSSDKENLSWNPVFIEFARQLNCHLLKDMQHGKRYNHLSSILEKNDFSGFDCYRVGNSSLQDEFNNLFKLENKLLSDYIEDESLASFLTSKGDYTGYYDLNNFPQDICKILYQNYSEKV